MIGYLGLALFMFVTLIFDIKSRRIPWLWLTGYGLFTFAFGYLLNGDFSYFQGMVVGPVIAVFGLISKGIDMEDAAVIGICGGYMVITDLLIALFYGLLLCSAVGAMMSVKSRRWRSRRLIFTPFLALGIILTLGGEYLG